MPAITIVKAIVNFFGVDNANTYEHFPVADNGNPIARKVSMDEMKGLTLEDKRELAALIVAETGETLHSSKAAADSK